MNISDRLYDIIATLEDAVSYGDIELVESARKELGFLAEELESTYDGIDSLDDEDY